MMQYRTYETRGCAAIGIACGYPVSNTGLKIRYKILMFKYLVVASEPERTSQPRAIIISKTSRNHAHDSSNNSRGGCNGRESEVVAFGVVLWGAVDAEGQNAHAGGRVRRSIAST